MSTQYFDEDGQEYGFDTHGMRIFTDRTFTCELSMASVNKKALAKVLGGEPINRCVDCEHYAGEGMYCAKNILVPFDHFYCYYSVRKKR